MFPKRAAESVKTYVEAIVSAKVGGFSIDAETMAWIRTRPDALADKLAAVGLIPNRERATLGEFLADFQRRRVDVKGTTHVVWGQAIRNLLEHFGAERTVQSITAGDADDFKMYLVGQGLSPTTIHKRLSFCRQFFRAMKRRGLIDDTPFAEVRMQAVSDPNRQRFITLEETQRILDACPDHTWRTIVGLARFGGLRCPSEVLSVKLADVDWEHNRMTVTSPKTEHHQGRQSRVIPLFHELRPIVEEAFDMAPEGAVYLVGGQYREKANHATGWRNCNLRTHFARIVRRAGLEPWPRLFHNLRATRETELSQEYPIHVVTSWLGNTPKIALKHYLQVTDADYERAATDSKSTPGNPAQIPAQYASETACKVGHKKRQTPVFPEGNEGLPWCTNVKVEDNGLEPMTFWLPARQKAYNL